MNTQNGVKGAKKQVMVPVLTTFLEDQRKQQQVKVSKSDMAAAMGISHDTYKRRLKDPNGFTNKELEAGFKVLGYSVLAINTMLTK